MDFTLDEAQRAVADLTADLLRRQSGSGHSAEAFAEDPGYDQSLWKSMAQAGLLCLAVPSALGGDGLGALETALLLAEVGRRAAAVPAFATLALGVLPVAMAGTAAAQRQLLAGVAEGEVLLSGAVNEAGQPFPALPRTTATPSGDGFLVSGTKVAVPYAAAARHILVPATLPDGRVVVPVVDPALAGVKLTRTPSSTGAPEYTLVLDSVWIAPGRMLGDGVAAALYRCALAGACAVGDGAVAGALALTSEHAGSRNQFGRPVAAFQAVAQQLADVYIAARTLHLATLSACWRLAAGCDPDDDILVAAYWLAQEAPPAMHTCHHLHGGLGVDVTYPMHRYYALVKDLVRFTGGREHRLDVLGAGTGVREEW